MLYRIHIAKISDELLNRQCVIMVQLNNYPRLLLRGSLTIHLITKLSTFMRFKTYNCRCSYVNVYVYLYFRLADVVSVLFVMFQFVEQRNMLHAKTQLT